MSDLLFHDTWQDVARLVSGLVSVEDRRSLVARLLDTNVLVAARCATAAGPDPVLQEMIERRASALVASEPERALAALIEVGRVDLAIQHLLALTRSADEMPAVINLLLRYDHASLDQYFTSVHVTDKAHQKLLRPTVQALDPALLADPSVQRHLARWAKELLEAHLYVELKTLARRIGTAMRHVIDVDIADMIARLIEASEHLATKHKRLGLAQELIQQFDLDGMFPPSRIAEAILRDNAGANLPNRSQLLGILRKSLRDGRAASTEDLSRYVRVLLSSPGADSVALAAEWATRYSLPLDVPAAVAEFVERRMTRDDARVVRDLIPRYGLSDRYRNFEWLGKQVEGEIVSIGPAWVYVRVPGVTPDCRLRKTDFEKRGKNTRLAIGVALTADVIRTTTSGLVLGLPRRR
ncbi:MAG TPA: hypothetical protein VNA69_10210 [Thermoanaerobaculia bacterium]|nr:hypothetical protein [Thermoanaerobaculia bacterium]